MKIIYSFRWMRLYLALLSPLFVLVMQIEAFAQTTSYVITGKVTEARTGETIPGAGVKILNTNFATAANGEGQFNLRASLNRGKYQIVFSFLGFSSQTKTIELGSSSTVVVNTELSQDVVGLDEVIVTGSTVKESRRQLGNAISTVKSGDLLRTGTANLISALQGKVPGAQITQNSGDPSGGVSIRLRGIKSVIGTSDPLYVIDGVISSNASSNISQTALSNQVASSNVGTNRLADINPADIETINVINGAAAAAQYGSRASNGVVIITTKRGTTGRPIVSFTTSFNTNELRKKIAITTYGKQFGFSSLRLHTISGITPAQIVANPGTTVTPIVREGVTTNLATNLVDVTRFDYQNEIFRTGIGTDNNVSLKGGNDKTQYFSSLSYMKNQGIVGGTDFQRYSLRGRLDQRLTDWVKMSVGLSYFNSLSNEKANGNVFYSPINSVNITNNIWDITQRDALGQLKAVEPTRVNPLTTIEEMQFSQRVNRTVNDIQFNFTPLKGLNIDWIAGLDNYSALGDNFIPPYPYAAEAGLPLERYPNGFASTVNNSVTLFNNDLNITYERDLIKDLRVTVIGGTSYQHSRSDLAGATGESLAPFIETVNGASSTTVKANSSIDRFNVSGVFLQSTFNYKSLLYVTGAVRNDRSSKFSPSESNQVYPKVSTSFVLSDLNGWNENSFTRHINALRLRMSWGQAGNLTGIGSYDRFWQFQAIPFLGKNTITPSSILANPRVRPERMTETEGGFDMGLANNRVNIGFTTYKQKVKDLVVNRVLASTSGGTSIVNNVGTLENQGMEISMGVSPVKTETIGWDATLLFNRNKNKMTSLGSPTVPISTVSGAPVFLVEGQPASVFYGNPYARNTDGTLLLTTQGLPQRERGIQTSTTTFTPQRDAAGQPTGSFVRTIIGDPNPKWTGSFSNSFSYKKASFRFLVDVLRGSDVFNADKRTRQNVGIGDLAEKELRGELPRGYIFSLVPIEEFRIDNGSYVKLREISLSYQLPNFVKGISSMNITVTGRNLFSSDNYNGYDPETNAGGNSDLQRGVDFGNVPIPRSFQFQISASF
jgi:TonB-linked SusC/RagA family outer membrane protein